MLMTPAEEGAFIRLLALAWQDENCTLPDDDKRLAVLSRLGKGWLKGGSSTKLRRKFVPHPNLPGRLYNERLMDERARQNIWREKSKDGGLKSAKMRSEKSKILGNSQDSPNCGSTVVEGWLENGSNQTSTLLSPSLSPPPSLSQEDNISSPSAPAADAALSEIPKSPHPKSAKPKKPGPNHAALERLKAEWIVCGLEKTARTSQGWHGDGIASRIGVVVESHGLDRCIESIHAFARKAKLKQDWAQYCPAFATFFGPKKFTAAEYMPVKETKPNLRIDRDSPLWLAVKSIFPHINAIPAFADDAIYLLFQTQKEADDVKAGYGWSLQNAFEENGSLCELKFAVEDEVK